MKRPYRRRRRILRRCAGVCQVAISVPKSSALGYRLLVRKPLLLEPRGAAGGGNGRRFQFYRRSPPSPAVHAGIARLTDRTVCFGGRRRASSVEPAAAVSTRSTRWRTALSHVGSIAILAFGSACASHTPDAVPAADGPYIAASPEAFDGRVIGAGYCVDLVTAAAGLPRTAAWREGAEVQGNPHIAPGTAIATFGSDGSYTSESGNHAAIYLHPRARLSASPGREDQNERSILEICLAGS